MTTTTAALRTFEPSLVGRGFPRPARGFTLVEMMVASVVSLIVVACAVSTFVFLAGGSLRLGQYSEMENQSRRLLQQFNQDVRQASDATWTNSTTLNLSVAGRTVTYAYDSAKGTLSRTPAGGSSAVLASGLTSFSFRAFQITGTEIPLASSPAAAGAFTKMIQINLGLAQRNAATESASSQLISARCVLRNKKLN